MKLRELLEVIPLANQNISIRDEEWENDYFEGVLGLYANLERIAEYEVIHVDAEENQIGIAICPPQSAGHEQTNYINIHSGEEMRCKAFRGIPPKVYIDEP